VARVVEFGEAEVLEGQRGEALGDGFGGGLVGFELAQQLEHGLTTHEWSRSV
jgi:hypothetical protein